MVRYNELTQVRCRTAEETVVLLNFHKTNTDCKGGDINKKENSYLCNPIIYGETLRTP